MPSRPMEVMTLPDLILTELARDWSTPAGQSLLPIVGGLIPRGNRGVA